MSKRIPEPEPPLRTDAVPAGEIGDAEVEEYVRHRDPLLRNRLVVRYGPLVTRIAGRTAARLPAHVERADLVSAGTLGLLEALQRFDPGLGHSFESFAAVRIHGAMLDDVRTLDVMPRSYWSKRREVDRVASTLGNQLGRQPAVHEVSSVVGLPVAEVARLRSGQEGRVSALDETVVEEAAQYDGSTVRDPEQAAVDADIRSRLLLAVDGLPDRSHRIITWYYREAMTFAQIATRLGVTESRVAQLHTSALKELRARMKRP